MTPAQRKASLRHRFNPIFPYAQELRLISTLTTTINSKFSNLINKSINQSRSDQSDFDILEDLTYNITNVINENEDDLYGILPIVSSSLNNIIALQYEQMQEWLDYYTGNNYIIPVISFTSYINQFIDQLRQYIKSDITFIISAVRDKLIGDLSSFVNRIVNIINYFKTKVLNKVKLTARNFVGNFNALVQKTVFGALGLDAYQWITVGDEKVRSIHRTLNYKICLFSNPFVYSLDGIEFYTREADMESGKAPGEPVNCRCSAILWIINQLREIDNSITNGL